MISGFDKFDTNTLKYTKQYRVASIISIIFFALWTTYCGYSAFLSNHAEVVKWLNSVVFYILLSNFVLSCVMYKLIRIIEKLKSKVGIEVADT